MFFKWRCVFLLVLLCSYLQESVSLVFLVSRIIPSEEFEDEILTTEQLEQVGLYLDSFLRRSSGGKINATFVIIEEIYYLPTLQKFEDGTCTYNDEVYDIDYVHEFNGFVHATANSSYGDYDFHISLTVNCGFYSNTCYSNVPDEEKRSMTVSTQSTASDPQYVAMMYDILLGIGVTGGAYSASSYHYYLMNPYDPMGNTTNCGLYNHGRGCDFGLYAKYRFGWLAPEQFSFRANKATATNVIRNDNMTVTWAPESTWLYAYDEDDISYANNTGKKYGIFYQSSKSNVTLTIGFRSTLNQNESGVLIEYGETTYNMFKTPMMMTFLIDPNGRPYGMNNETGAYTLKVGEVYIHDNFELGDRFLIRLDEIDTENHRALIYTETLESDSFALVQDSLPTTTCGETVTFTNASVLYKVEGVTDVSNLYFHPSECGTGSLKIGMYLQEPFHLFMNSSAVFDPSGGIQENRIHSNRGFYRSNDNLCTNDVETCDFVISVYNIFQNSETTHYQIYRQSLPSRQSSYFTGMPIYHAVEMSTNKSSYFVSVTFEEGGTVYYAWCLCDSFKCKYDSSSMYVASTTPIDLFEMSMDNIAVTVPNAETSSVTWETACVSGPMTFFPVDIFFVTGFQTYPLSMDYYLPNGLVHPFRGQNYTYILLEGNEASEGLSVNLTCAHTTFCGQDRTLNETTGECEDCPTGHISQAGRNDCISQCNYMLYERIDGLEESSGIIRMKNEYSTTSRPQWINHLENATDSVGEDYNIFYVDAIGWSVGDHKDPYGRNTTVEVISQLDVRHPMLGDTSNSSRYSFTCFCEAFPDCGLCPGDSIINPIDGTSCFVPYSEVSIYSDSLPCIGGKYTFVAIVDGMPVFESLSGSYILTRMFNGTWTFISTITNEIILSGNASAAVYWPSDLSSENQTVLWDKNLTGLTSTAYTSDFLEDFYTKYLYQPTNYTIPRPIKLSPISSPTSQPTLVTSTAKFTLFGSCRADEGEQINTEHCGIAIGFFIAIAMVLFCSLFAFYKFAFRGTGVLSSGAKFEIVPEF